MKENLEQNQGKLKKTNGKPGKTMEKIGSLWGNTKEFSLVKKTLLSLYAHA